MTHQIVNIALLILRIFLGYFFIPNGWAKIIGGQEKWLWLGQQMGNLGIHFAPIFWGLAATMAEFLGGFALLFGFGTRIASLFMAFTMFVATVMHVTNNDSWQLWSKPLVFMLVFIVISICGAGAYSIDHWLHTK